MPRTTVNIDAPILRDLKRLQKREGKSLGRLISDLLAVTLRESESTGDAVEKAFDWISKPMGSRVDLADKDAVWNALDTDRDE